MLPLIFVVNVALLTVVNFVSIAYAEDRIVGGFDAEKGQFPYQISLQRRDRHICGGSILNERWILTAAHCVVGQNPTRMKVMVGTHLLDKGGDKYEVEKLIPHADYDSEDISNDIALVQLKNNITFGPDVKPVQLPVENTASGKRLLLSGWGTTAYPGKTPNKLQAIFLNSIDTEECKKIHKDYEVKDSNICTFTKEGEGACHGDSGGPLVENEYQVGVVSWGIPCAKGKPDVFTRVHSYLDWIKEHMS